MSVITEKKLRSIVKRFLQEKRVISEDVDMTDELSKIIATLGAGKQINKSLLKGALAAGAEGRAPKHDKVLADLFMAIIGQGSIDPKVITLLKKAGEESSPGDAEK